MRFRFRAGNEPGFCQRSKLECCRRRRLVGLEQTKRAVIWAKTIWPTICFFLRKSLLHPLNYGVDYVTPNYETI